MYRFCALIISLISFWNVSFAIISAYIGANIGVVNGKADGGFKNDSGGTVGGNAGVELNLLLTKVGLEAFVDKSIGFESKKDGNLTYKNPLFYGGKAKLMMNFIFVEPYLALGYGQEKVNEYKNDFLLGGLGLQAKLFGIGAFIETNYLKSTKKYEGMKTERFAVQVGLKYYFI